MLEPFFRQDYELGNSIANEIFYGLIEVNAEHKQPYNDLDDDKQIMYILPIFEILTRLPDRTEAENFEIIFNIISGWCNTFLVKPNFAQKDQILILATQININIMVNSPNKIIQMKAYHFIRKIIQEPLFEYLQNTWLTILNVLIDSTKINGSNSTDFIELALETLKKSQISIECRASILKSIQNVFNMDSNSGKWQQLVEDTVSSLLLSADKENQANFFVVLWEVTEKDTILRAIEKSLISTAVENKKLLIPNTPFDSILSIFASYLFTDAQLTLSLSNTISKVFGVNGVKDQNWINVLVNFLEKKASTATIDEVQILMETIQIAYIAHPKILNNASIQILSKAVENRNNIILNDSVKEFLIAVLEHNREKEEIKSKIKLFLEATLEKFKTASSTPEIIVLANIVGASFPYQKLISCLSRPQLQHLILKLSSLKLSQPCLPFSITLLLSRIDKINISDSNAILDAFMRVDIDCEFRKKISEMIKGKIIHESMCDFLQFAVKAGPFESLSATDSRNLLHNSGSTSFYITTGSASIAEFVPIQDMLRVVIRTVAGDFCYDISRTDDSIEKDIIKFCASCSLVSSQNYIMKISDFNQSLEDKFNAFSNSIYRYCAVTYISSSSSSVFESKKISRKYVNFLRKISNYYSHEKIVSNGHEMFPKQPLPYTDNHLVRCVFVPFQFFDNKDDQNISEFLTNCSVLLVFNESGRKINARAINTKASVIISIQETESDILQINVLQCSDSFAMSKGTQRSIRSHSLHSSLTVPISHFLCSVNPQESIENINKRFETLQLMARQKSVDIFVHN